MGNSYANAVGSFQTNVEGMLSNTQDTKSEVTREMLDLQEQINGLTKL
jgi:hypothetical protein